MSRLRILPVSLLALACLGRILAGQDLPVAAPEEVGLSSERLARLTGVMQQHIDQEKLAGVVALVARQGKVVYLEALGMQDREAQTPMRRDTILRIASMTKPITSLAVMMLYEEGRFSLNDRISTYIPAFKDARVLVNASESGSSDQATVPAKPGITIRHLLTHTSGLTYHWDPKLGSSYAESGVTHGLLPDSDTLADDIPRLAGLPLLHQPGEKWTYGLSIDVLGYLVEVVSGMPLDEFFRTRIFEPLGMKDTHFLVPAEKRNRLAAAYAPDPNGGLRRLEEEEVQEGTMTYSAAYPYQGSHRFLSGGGGLSSTVPDYFRFAQMMLNGGELNGVRLLSPKTVELMTTNHVGDLRRNIGFGYGFGVVRDLGEYGELGSPGTYFWGSFWYGTFFIDPMEELIGISVAQLHPDGGATLNQRFTALVEQAIVE